jgi:hypothetical protein
VAPFESDFSTMYFVGSPVPLSTSMRKPISP